MDDIIDLLKSRSKIDNIILEQNKDIKDLIQKLERKNCELEDWQQLAIHYYKN
jgi:light-regulated signal transduction histidine kinase (bacteriophytochrome)